ncbi:MAG: asparagine synthase (glutamine-hydrolyzing), partial [Myxococcota bacterium]
MGGLAGILHFDDDRPDLRALRAMSERLAHRGPDGQGEWEHERVAFTHRRRAVVPTRSRQPLVTDDMVVMLDGWIYDHLKVALAAGDDRTDLTDVQALALAWRRWGTSLTEHLDGAFAAAIWDRNEQELHLIRDRQGIRPLYWAREGERFAFASELPALLAVPWIRPDLNGQTLSEYLTFRVVHSPRTLIRAIKQVEAGHWLRVREGDLRVRRYWSMPYPKPGVAAPPAGPTIQLLQEQLEQGVRRRLAQDAPAALYLSGGLGSTAIAAAARRLGHHLPSWTIGFADDPNPESPFAGRVASLLGLEHHEVVVGSPELAASFDRTVATLGHPIASPAALLQMLLAERVSPHARIVLSGDGGEELFGGRMLDSATAGLRRTRIVGRLPRRAQGPAAHLLTGRGAVDHPHLFGLARELGGSHLFSTEQRQALLTDADQVRPWVRHEVLVRFYEDVETDPINAVLHAFLCSWLREESLTRADRTSAATGLDVRFPLLDRDVVEVAASLPGSFKSRRRGGALRTRWPLRAMLDGVIPASLINRPKRSLPVPMDRWLAGPGRLFLADRSERLQSRHLLFRPAAIRDLVQDVARRPGAGMQLWSLFIL